MQKFDLNIENFLGNWEPSHAIREIIANALDEQLLSNTADIEIEKTDNVWCIRDFGRGLKYQHLTQNENPEKEAAEGVIGRFGVGLKDAFATLYNNNIGVVIKSKYGVITLEKCQKGLFDDVVTLHEVIDQPEDEQMVGTAVYLHNCRDEDVEKAKGKFLRFSDERVLENTEYGQIIEKKQDVANIYINGVKVAEESNFAFSYNITSLTKQIKNSLNRERKDVSRTAYAERVKAMLKMSKNYEVINILTKNMELYKNGGQCDEISWVDVASHVAKMMSNQGDTIFVEPNELANNTAQTNEIIHSSGKRIIIAPERVIMKAKQETNGRFYTTHNAIEDYNRSFSYSFVNVEDLTENERANWNKLFKLLKILSLENWFDKCYITETLKMDFNSTVGLWDRTAGKIIILRSQLNEETALFGTVICEVIHALTDCESLTRKFEGELAGMIGILSTLLLLEIEDKEGTN